MFVFVLLWYSFISGSVTQTNRVVFGGPKKIRRPLVAHFLSPKNELRPPNRLKGVNKNIRGGEIGVGIEKTGLSSLQKRVGGSAVW